MSFRTNGPTLVGFSGGRTSGYMLRRMLEAYNGKLPDDTIVCFQNTGDEDERTLAFVDRVSREWGVPIVWLEYTEEFNYTDYMRAGGAISERRKKRDLTDPKEWGFSVVNFETASRNGEPFDKMLDYYAAYRKQIKDKPPILPNVAQRVCTSYLKIKISQRYMEVLGHKEYDAFLGIRADEPRRHARMMAANDAELNRFVNVTPLYDAGVTKDEVKAYWNAQPFDLEIDPNSDEGNCRYCFLKSKAKLVKIMSKHIVANKGVVPADLLRMINREKRTGQTFRRDRPRYEDLAVEAMSYTGETFADAVDEPIIDCFCGET
jgi:3'-phosphoadenosine 5'-phosphosulfate sulfotransferase (PAPS reductase)/FAD synthetase